jgi:pyrroline-5-carboxylate reductase
VSGAGLRLAVLGGGVMGTSLLSGLLAAGWDSRAVVVAERSDTAKTAIRKLHGVDVVSTPAEAMAHADIAILSVKPQDVFDALKDVRRADGPCRLLISVCAGVTTSLLEQLLSDVGIVRAMPNTPVSLRQGAIAIVGGSRATQSDLATAEWLLGMVGTVRRVPEDSLDAVTAISGSGPAYLFLLAEAMIEAGIGCGLPADVASDLTRQTLLGASTLLASSGEPPALLRQAVTSPAGTAAAALGVLERRRFRATILDAVRASAARSRQLGDSVPRT